MKHRGARAGDIYGPSAGGSTILDTHMGEAFSPGRFMREGQYDEPVTPSVAGGVQVGQFTLAQATVGLLVLLGFVWYADRRL